LNIAVQEIVKRAPVNVRPLFFIEQRRNFKGIALFALANFRTYDLFGAERYLQEATTLCDWLLNNQSGAYPEFCGGHQHAIQQVDATVPARSPDIVSTSYAVRALLRYAEHEQSAGAAVTSAADFIRNRLESQEIAAGRRIKYRPGDEGDAWVLDANALGARLLLDSYAWTGEDSALETATDILDYVAANQTDYGGWMYAEPASASHRTMDNYHNGFIIESFARYREVTGSTRFDDVLDRAASFYRSVLYDETGAPNWTENRSFPKDIHAAAQGIVTFSQLGQPSFAGRILRWTLENLYAGDGRFYYQKRLGYTKRFTLVRWCQAWMAHALSTYHANRH
jgi:hypothetical protein